MRGARTEAEKTLFPVIFLRNGTSRKKGTNWCSWRVLKSCCCTYITGNGVKAPKRYQNDGTFRVHSDRHKMLECTFTTVMLHGPLVHAEIEYN